MNFYDDLKNRFNELIRERDLFECKLDVVSAIPLEPEEAIGNPGRNDFPIIRGKEVMIQADFLGNKGQAFTDSPGNFNGTLNQVLKMPLNTNYEKAVLIATINAVLRKLRLISKTIHCRNEEPAGCAEKLVEYIRDNYGNPKVLLIGYQPAMLESLTKHFRTRITDLNPDNIGKTKFGVMIEDGKDASKAIDWADVIFATGSTISNGTLPDILKNDKEIIFYGVTISGPAYLLGLKKYCYYGH